jgi:L-fuconolactonase
MKIDSHQHFWKYDPARDAWITDAMSLLKRDFLPKDLTPEREWNGIDASIAVQADQSEKETLFLLDLADRNKNIAGVVGWVDLSSSRVAERLRFFPALKNCVGSGTLPRQNPTTGSWHGAIL